MTTQTMRNREASITPQRNDWLRIGLKTALFSVLAVLLVQALALALWPEIALFKPLDSYLRSALFTLVPALGATAVFAWLVQHQARPVRKFVILSAVVLLLSFIPDYALPVAHKTLLTSTVAAFMHLTAGVVTVATLLGSYRRRVGSC